MGAESSILGLIFKTITGHGKKLSDGESSGEYESAAAETKGNLAPPSLPPSSSAGPASKRKKRKKTPVKRASSASMMSVAGNLEQEADEHTPNEKKRKTPGTKVSQPENSYERDVSGELRNGTVITVKGTVNPDADRFQINLCRGNDIAFHFNPRFDENKIVSKSLIGNSWGPEERDHPFFPFKRGESFEVKILCTYYAFKVEVGGRHILDFAHRIREFHEIDKLTVDQNAVTQSVTIDQKHSYEQHVRSELRNRTVITVKGTVNPDAHRFQINLCRGNDIAFHLNPRFNENQIVRNTLIGNSWGPEERDHPFFPFRRGESFEVKILCTDHEFKVEVDGRNMLDYSHRIKEIYEIDKLTVYQHAVTQSVDIDHSDESGHWARSGSYELLPPNM